jgi:hypothetical protein
MIHTLHNFSVLVSAFLQHSTMSLPNRSHSITEISNGSHDSRRPRPVTLHNGNGISNNALLYQRSLSHLKTNNETNGDSMTNGDEFYRQDKSKLLPKRININGTDFDISHEGNSSWQRRSYQPPSNDHQVYRTESLSRLEHDDSQRPVRVYQYETQEKYANRFDREQVVSNTQINAAPYIAHVTHDIK